MIESETICKFCGASDVWIEQQSGRIIKTDEEPVEFSDRDLFFCNVCKRDYYQPEIGRNPFVIRSMVPTPLGR